MVYKLTYSQPDTEALELEVPAPNHPHFSLAKCSQPVQAALGVGGNSPCLIETFAPDKNHWVTHQSDLVRVVAHIPLLLYRKRGVAENDGMREAMDRVCHWGKARRRPAAEAFLTPMRTMPPHTPASPVTPSPLTAAPIPFALGASRLAAASAPPAKQITGVPMAFSFSASHPATTHAPPGKRTKRKRAATPSDSESDSPLEFSANDSEELPILVVQSDDDDDGLDDIKIDGADPSIRFAPASARSDWPLKPFLTMAKGFRDMERIGGTTADKFKAAFPMCKDFRSTAYYENLRVWQASTVLDRRTFAAKAWCSTATWKAFCKLVDPRRIHRAAKTGRAQKKPKAASLAPFPMPPPSKTLSFPSTLGSVVTPQSTIKEAPPTIVISDCLQVRPDDAFESANIASPLQAVSGQSGDITASCVFCGEPYPVHPSEKLATLRDNLLPRYAAFPSDRRFRARADHCALHAAEMEINARCPGAQWPQDPDFLSIERRLSGTLHSELLSVIQSPAINEFYAEALKAITSNGSITQLLSTSPTG